MTAIHIVNAFKSFSAKSRSESVIRDLTLEIKEGEWLSVCGQSGAGKSTLLRLIAGLDNLDAGSITIFGESPRSHYPRIAYVVQDYNSSLLPWRNALSNVALALLNVEKDRARRLEIARSALERVGLANSIDKYPWQLSGGMKQRVAIARAIAVRPVLLLLDEPFSSLDFQNREQLRSLVKEISKEDGITTVFVTHDIEEAALTADEVLLMGRPGSPAKLFSAKFEKPQNTAELRSNLQFVALVEDLRARI